MKARQSLVRTEDLSKIESYIVNRYFYAERGKQHPAQ
jgi:hypothetical protein